MKSSAWERMKSAAWFRVEAYVSLKSFGLTLSARARRDSSKTGAPKDRGGWPGRRPRCTGCKGGQLGTRELDIEERTNVHLG